ncbi:MAG: EVE domain-containing protein [Bacteroidota bacterium]
MNYWLVKSEPDAYSWKKFLEEKQTVWSGIRNFQARNNLRTMKTGDNVLFYHSNVGKEIVGVAKVIQEAYQDPTTKETAWLTVDLQPIRTLKKAITLDEIKSDSKLNEMVLLKNSRLSVQPVTKEEFERVIELSKK